MPLWVATRSATSYSTYRRLIKRIGAQGALYKELSPKNAPHGTRQIKGIYTKGSLLKGRGAKRPLNAWYVYLGVE